MDVVIVTEKKKLFVDWRDVGAKQVRCEIAAIEVNRFFFMPLQNNVEIMFFLLLLTRDFLLGKDVQRLFEMFSRKKII